MDVFRHHDERVQLKSTFATIAIHSSQEETNVIFDGEQASALPGRKGYEISSGRRDEASRLQERTSAAEAAIFAQA